MGRWCRQLAHAHFNRSPSSGPVGHEVGADSEVELRGKTLVEGPCGKLRLVEGCFEAKNVLGQQRGYFGAGEDTSGGFDEEGGAIWSRISWRRRISTGSCSKAMLWATS